VSASRVPWIIAVGAGLGLAALVVSQRGAGHGVGAHPEPRAGITAARVMAEGTPPRTPGSVESYAAARHIPGVLDGLYCHCECARHAGHRSLLTCFESDHGAYCDICMGEAILAAELTAQGRSLLEIRDAIDRQFGS
jgi:hypothetical protein